MPIDNLYETPSLANIALLQGTLDVLILKVLALQPMHGLGISRRIAQVTNTAFQVKPGSLYFYTVNAQFSGSTGTGKRVELRPCTLSFAKR